MHNALDISHRIVLETIKKGDFVIDATAGNGKDTILMAKLVGDTGKVYSFDIQEIAINNTLKKLKEFKLEDRVVMINDGHQLMDRYVKNKVKVVMFNLGYLPGGDHNISTEFYNTIKAVEISLRLLAKDGLIVMVVYSGGDSGFKEKDEVINFIKKLDQKKYLVLTIDFINQVNHPPILIYIKKL